MKTKHISLLTFVVALLMLVTTTVKADGFNVERTVTSVANPVTNTFTYTVTADASNPDTVTPPSGTYQVVMNNEAPSSNTASKTVAPLIAESVWTGLNYTKPGTYKFVVAETGSSNGTLYPKDTADKYEVTIYVENVLSDGIPTGSLNKTYIGAVLQGDPNPTKIPKTGNATFTSAAGGRSYLSISKTVKGNMADTNQCFDFTVALTGVTAGETYSVTGSSCSNSDITVASGATTANATVKAKHGETVTIGKSGNINQLPVGAGYTITEVAATGHDNTSYTTTINGTAGSSSGAKTVSSTATSNAYEFENTAQATTPTGIILRTLPFVVLVVLSVTGIVAIVNNKKLTKEQDQQ